MLTINATKRDIAEDIKKIREEGKVPAVFYGPKEETTSITIGEVELLKVYKEAGESSIITLKEGDEEHEALIHDIQLDAVSGKILHVDFYVIEKGKKVEVEIPLEFVGESAAVKLGGTLVKVIHDLKIEAMPKDLPQHVEVDISSLVDYEAQIKVSDVNLPEGVEAKVDADEVVALVQEAKEEVIEDTPEADLDSIEVEQKGKGEEATEESAE